MRQFTTNEIEPNGWLKEQLKIQANGLAGNLDKVWPDVRDSKWIGGSKEGWERVPYWLDGFVPLAYLLKDEDMINRAKRYINEIIKRQKEDGWICPCEDRERTTYDMWSLFLILKVLVLYADCSNDERIEEVVYKALKQYRAFINGQTPFNWGASRWFECLIPIRWLYERRKESWLLELATILKQTSVKYNLNLWKEARREWSFYTHVVNVAMMLKADCLYDHLVNGKNNGQKAEEIFTTLQKYHGNAYGHFNGDECLSGNLPIQGSELCGIVEAMYSYEWLLAITGDSVWGDRLEYLAFNGLPASISDDMWTHQYDQLVNQTACCSQNCPPTYLTNGPESNIFGLEPNYGCCTANFGQGWPKFALSSFMSDGNDIVSAILIPSGVKTCIDNNEVIINLKTNYPFRNILNYTVDGNAVFALKIRVPSWAKQVKINNKEVVSENGWIRVFKSWSGHEEITVEFETETEFIKRPNNMYCLRRGALLYAMPIESNTEMIEYEKDHVERKFPYCDYKILSAGKWNYAYNGMNTNVYEVNDTEIKFSRTNPPVYIDVPVVEIDWGYESGQEFICRHLPQNMQKIGPTVHKKFVPYGCTYLRMTEMPLI